MELTYHDKKEALIYLQSSVAKVVNHDDEEELKIFRELAMFLFPIKRQKLAEAVVVGGMVVDKPYDISSYD